jgi:hypothetical protein
MAWTTIDTTVHQAACNGIVDLFDGGSVNLLTSGDVALAAPVFAATAFGAATDANPSVATAATMTADTSVTAGTIAKCQFISSGATTLLAGSAGTSGADLILSAVEIPSGATSVTFSMLTFSVAVS